METTTVPAEFAEIFRGLVKALQPRQVDRETLPVYWAVLHTVPMAALRTSAATLAQGRFWPNTGDWYAAALAAASTFHPPAEGSRRLEELDALAPNDPERDEVCKGLSLDDQRALMARYGLPWK